MARSSDINQRIVLTGADEVRRHLEEIGKAGERAGSTTRASLLAATSGASAFTSGARSASASSGQMRFALQNLSFQVNDVATSLASGGDAARVFAQQGGQIFQVFQQGGGARAVLGGAASAIASLITPMTAAAAAAVVLGVEFAAVLARATSAQAATKRFDVILKATGRSGGVTGKELEAAAETLHDVGVSTSEAREQFSKFIGEGGLGRDAAKVTRAGADLNKVLGEGSLERFVSAAAKGGAPLEEIAKQLGIVVPNAIEAQKALDAATKSAAAFNKSISDAVEKRAESLAGVGRDSARQIEDLFRQRERERRVTGDPEVDARRQRAAQDEDIEIQSARRIEDINREHAAAINEIIRQRNQQNAEALKAYNESILAAAQSAADRLSLIDQIAQKVFGSFKAASTPLEQAILALSVAWNNFQDTLAKSGIIQQIITDLGEMVRSITAAIKWVDDLAAAIKKIPGLPAVLGGGAVPGAAGGGIVQTFAGGGVVRGPGTGTSDSIFARLSNGEFVMPALATRAFRPQLEAMRSMFSGFNMPRPRPMRFATGGMVSAGGGSRTPINLSIGGETFGLESDAATAQRVIRFARKKGTLSAGRRPSTA